MATRIFLALQSYIVFGMGVHTAVAGDGGTGLGEDVCPMLSSKETPLPPGYSSLDIVCILPLYKGNNSFVEILLTNSVPITATFH